MSTRSQTIADDVAELLAWGTFALTVAAFITVLDLIHDAQAGQWIWVLIEAVGALWFAFGALNLYARRRRYES